MVFFVGCKKKEIPQLENESPIKVVEYRLDKIPLTKHTSPLKASGTDIHELMKNPDDADDEKINFYLYEISLAIQELIKIPEFNQKIIYLAQQSETSSANLLDLATEAPQYYNAINAKLSLKSLSLQSIANDLTHAPIAPNPSYPITATVEAYVPAIFIPNLQKLNSNLQPILSPNVEVDSRFDENIEDNIIAWYYKDSLSTELEEIIISEATSLITTNPLFLLDNAVTTLNTNENKTFTPLISKGDPVTTGDTAVAKAKANVLSFDSYELSIESNSYRYEPWTSGKSEFAVSAVRIDPSGNIHWIYQNNADQSKVIYDVKKNEIGSIKYIWSHHASNWQPWSNPWTPEVTQYGVNMVFWNTFERDWNRTPKSLGTCTANGTTIYLSGNRKYDEEWYAWIPETTNIHYTRFEWIYDNWAHWNNSWKSKFRLWRVGA